MVTLLGMRRFWFAFFVYYLPTADNHFVAVIVVFYGKAVMVLFFDEFFIDWFPSKRFLT